ncbi:MAG TPA: metallophosphoesterase [Bryobacteraceae bacterium]|jgi:3',5'-cyclic AMP phosphodiesterase CpdA|nr:metallophosphoesterase [Bryobacteraceae bacterium]
MFKAIRALALLSPLAFLLAQTGGADSPFLEKPYLQLGNAPHLSSSESLELLWHTTDQPGNWGVELKTSKDSAWRAMDKPATTSINAPGIPSHLVYRTLLKGLVPGEDFQYRVLKSGDMVFTSSGRARKSAGQPYRVVVFGDCAQGTPESRAVAYQTSLAKPDFVLIPGDIVYGSGRISEYREKFFPVYNSETASPQTGAPLIRSIPFIAAVGNHDAALTNFQRYADALAFFLYWDEPLNGFVPSANSRAAVHRLTGNEEAQPPFLAAAGSRYPLMANFSFEYGNAHWLILDSNTYMDWTNQELRDWIAKDLAGAQNATWRFVAFHHPGFNSAKEHSTDQWMRTLAPVFEAGKVDIVFQGHVHNYQRSYPFTFTPKPQADGAAVGPKGEVAGDWNFDKSFKDGGNTRPQGVIYIVSGAGGAGLYSVGMQKEPSTWQPFTYKFVSEEHSMSVLDISGKNFKLKQISDSGQQVDAFQIVKQ